MQMLRLFFLLLIALLLADEASAQQWTDKTMRRDTLLREYRVYIPAAYDGTQAYPMVIGLHGLGDNMQRFGRQDWAKVADTGHFIVVIPQAVAAENWGTAWNSGAGAFNIFPNAHIDDVGFLNALMDTICHDYHIDSARIYLFGYSMGGFMAERMACESNGRLAAVVSVAGTIGAGIQCQPGRAIPIAHFHGTTDRMIGYATTLYGKSAPDLIQFWVQNNHCNPTPEYSLIPHTANDTFKVEVFTYTGAEPQDVVVHYKVNGAPHTWLVYGANDIGYTEEIWKFFRQFRRQE